MPHEITIAGIYFPPFLMVAMLAYSTTHCLSYICIKKGWNHYIVHPTLVELCLFIIFMSLYGLFLPIV